LFFVEVDPDRPQVYAQVAAFRGCSIKHPGVSKRGRSRYCIDHICTTPVHIGRGRVADGRVTERLDKLTQVDDVDV
jgi:hypothetical protein